MIKERVFILKRAEKQRELEQQEGVAPPASVDVCEHKTVQDLHICYFDPGNALMPKNKQVCVTVHEGKGHAGTVTSHNIQQRTVGNQAVAI